MSNILDLLGNVFVSILYSVPALPLAVAVAIVYMINKGKDTSKLYALGLGAFILYIYAALDLTLISRISVLLQYADEPVVRSISLIPFDNMVTMATTHYEGVNYNVFVRNVFGNIIMFAPLGVFLPVLFTRFRSMGRVVAMAAVLSFSIEFIQYWIGGVTDIDDLMMNTLGATIGYATYALCAKVLPRLKAGQAYSGVYSGYTAGK